MYRLRIYLKNYRAECVLAPLFKMLEAAFELTVPLVIARLIDNGIKKADSDVIYRSFGLLVLLAATGLIVSVIAQFFAAKAATGFSKELRHDLFSHILSFDFPRIDSIGTDTMITRMTVDVNTLQNGVNMFLRLFLRSPFIVTGAMIMAFTIDTKSAFVFVLVILALSLIVFFITKTNIPLLLKAQKKLDDVLCLVRENLSGARVIRAFTLEDSQISDFEDTNRSLTSIQLHAGRLSGLLNPLTYVVVNLGIVLLIKVGDVQVNAGILSTGEVVALYNYMSQILIELIKFANLIVTVNRTIASAKRVNEIFDERPSMNEAMPADDMAGSNASFDTDGSDSAFDPESDIAVRFDDVSLKYHEDADEAVSSVSFDVKTHETFGIIGGTGAGKTTVANLVARFYDTTKGSVYLFGQDVKTLSGSVIRDAVGIVMQKAVLFEGTVRDNLKWGNPDATDKELLEAVENAACTDVIDGRGGLDLMIEAGGRNLSGGQRQRLCIARVLLKKPKILILDDSSSALDYMTDEKLRHNIMNLSYHPTTIIIAQRTISVRNCDRIMVMDDGEVAGIAPHSELLSSCSVYKEIYDSQYHREEE